MSRLSGSEQMLGRIMAWALDHVKAAFAQPEDWNVAIIVTKKNDPATTFLTGNMQPDQIKAIIELIEIDGAKVGTMMRDGTYREAKP